MQNGLIMAIAEKLEERAIEENINITHIDFDDWATDIFDTTTMNEIDNAIENALEEMKEEYGTNNKADN